MTSSFRPTTFILPAILAAMGTITVASAQSSSPFAKKNKAQAWETIPNPVQQPVQQPVQLPVPKTAPVPRQLNNYGTSAQQSSQTQAVPPPNWQAYQNPAPQVTAQPSASSSSSDVYYPGRRKGGAKPAQDIGNYETNGRAVKPSNDQPAFTGQNYSPRQPQVRYHGEGNVAASPYGDPNQPQWSQQQGQATKAQPQPQSQGQAYQPQSRGDGLYQDQYNPQYKNRQGQHPQQAEYGDPQYGAPNTPAPKRSWKDRFSFGNWQTVFRGSATVGAAAVNNADGDSGWGAEFIGDVDAEVEVSTITQGGLEYGATLGARAQYDRFRRGFGQRLPDCPPTAAGCSTADIGGTPTGLRGHTSQFFSDGADDARAEEVQLETAYVFLRSAYGDVTLGRDDGSAYLFSLGAPSLLKTSASNSPVDYTGFDSVKTVNDASGFAEKVTYTSPRLLGDTVGVGVQFGVSYAPNALGCGVDNCIRSNNDQGSGTVAADLRNVAEVGVAFDRNFGNGFKAELTASYARADERSGLAGLDDLSAYNAGLELTYNDWILGGSYLNSNNGLENGDYEAYDVGLTWKPSKLGFTLGYGHASDDNVNLTSDQAVFGVSYDFDRITLGGGVQYIDRTTSVFDGVNVTSRSEDATAIFIETGFKF